MEYLPTDVLLIILQKLAAQDPLSLLRTTCATARFYRVAGDNPGVWKEAFYGPIPAAWLEELAPQNCCPRKCAKLDAEVEALGGFRSLLTARLFSAKKPTKIDEKVEQKHALNECKVASKGEEYSAKVMVVARLRGRVVLWRLYSRDRLERGYPSWPTYFNLSLQSLHSVNFEEVLLKDARERGESRPRYNHRFGQSKWLTFELYAPSQCIQGVETLGKRLWCAEFDCCECRCVQVDPWTTPKEGLVQLRGLIVPAYYRDYDPEFALRRTISFPDLDEAQAAWAWTFRWCGDGK